MMHVDGTRQYNADDGKMLVRKSDGLIMGDGLDLGIADTIDNYEERAFTEEERAAFWESIGIDDPKKLQDKDRLLPQNNGYLDMDDATSKSTNNMEGITK